MRLLALLLPNFMPQFFELFLQLPVEFDVNNFCRRLSLPSQRLHFLLSMPFEIRHIEFDEE